MDIAAAIGTLSQAIGVVKSLKELDHSFDVAMHKARVAELYEALADVKMALSDARQELHDKDTELQRLRQEIDALKKGEVCPICNNGRLKIIASKPHPHFAFAGVQERTIVCDAEGCGHRENRLHDPSGVTKRGRS